MQANMWKYSDSEGGSLYCELCDYKAATSFGYEAHIHGFKHKKKAEMNVLNDSHRGSRGIGQNSEYHCKICEVFCSSRQMLNTHLRGQKHLKKVANTDNSVGFYQEPLADGVYSVLEAKLIDYDKAIVGLSFVVEIQPTDSSKEPRFLCELCDAKSDIRVVVSHLIGQKHRQNYLKHTRWDDYETIIIGKNNSKMKADELEVLMVSIEAQDGRGTVVIKKEIDESAGDIQPAAKININNDPDNLYQRGRDRHSSYDRRDSPGNDRGYRRSTDDRRDYRDRERSPRRRSPSPRRRSPSPRSRSPSRDNRDREETVEELLKTLLRKMEVFEIDNEGEASLALSVSNLLTQKLMSYRLTRIPTNVRNLLGREAGEQKSGYSAPEPTRGYSTHDPGRGYSAADPGRGYSAPDPVRGFSAPDAGRGYSAPDDGRDYTALNSALTGVTSSLLRRY